MRFAVAIVLACVGCGRLDFEARRDATATGDGGGSDQVRRVARSVGATNAALAEGTGALMIAGSTATFGADLPARIGVGDVVEYDADGDGMRDSLAFIAARTSPRSYTVRSATGDAPVPTSAPTTGWAVFRAYLTLADAVDKTRAGTRNPQITAGTFDIFTGGRDLVAANELRDIACYDGAVDPDPLEICDTSYTRSCPTGWTTDASHYLRIFTPVSAAEVGASQRHAGTWGTGYRRTGGIIMYQGFIRLDGLAIQRSVDGNGRTYYVETEGHGGEIWISNSFGWNSIAGDSKVFDIWDTGVAALGPDYTVLKLWNDIAYVDTTTDQRSGFYFNSNRAEVHAANCTAYVPNGGAFYESSLAHATLTNCLGFSVANPAFAADDGFQLVGTSVSNDDSLGPLGGTNAWNVPVVFASAANADLHLGATVPKIHGAGADLHADPVTPFADDIDGQARPAGAWDIGADQAP
ncbi:MAG TPA: hypothetical protein VIV58_17070 [Kofleriaceae bacterium]